MDAANTLKTFSLISALAAAALLPGAAQAQTLQVNGSGTPAQVSWCGSQALSISVASSDGTTAIPFNVGTVPYFVTLSATSGTTPATIGLQYTQQATAQSFNVNFTSAKGNVSLPIAFQPSCSSGGGNGNQNGPVTTTPTSLSFSTAQGNPSYQTLTINNGTGGAISYALSADANASAWLTIPNGAAVGTIANGGSLGVLIQASASGLAQNLYNGNLILTYGSNTQVSIPVSFTVGSGFGNGNGGLSLSTTNVAWSYSSGAALPTSTVTVTSSASVFSASVISSQGNFLALGAGGNPCGQGAVYTVPVSGGLTLCTNSNLQSLAAGTYTGTVQVTDANSATNTITVTLTVGGSGTNNGGLTASSTSVNLSATPGSTTAVQQSVNITSNTSGTLNVTYSGTGISATLASNNVLANQADALTIYGNPSGLSAGTYNGSVTVAQSGIGSVTINVAFTVGTGTGTGTGTGNTAIVAPTSLTFNYELNTATTYLPQQVTLTAGGNYTATTTYNSGSGWISVSSSGNGPAYPQISINPSGLLAGTYTGYVTFATPNGSANVNVTLHVTSTPVLYGSPTSINTTVSAGSMPTASIFVNTSDGSSFNYLSASASSDQGWLTIQNTGPNYAVLLFNPGNLANGVYTGSVTIATDTINNPPLTVPVVMTVIGSTVTGGSLTFSSSSLTLSAQPNGGTASTNLTVTPPSGASYTATVGTSTCGTNWLSISPFGGTYNTAQTFTVSANPTGLASGTTCNGSLTFTSNGIAQNVGVTFVVSNTASGGSVTATPNSLSFNFQSGGSTPQAQVVQITSASGSSPVNFTVSTTTQNGVSWLSTNFSSSATPANLQVSVTPGTLQPGSYTGSVVITPTGGSPVTVPVTFTVQGLPTVTTSVTSLPLSYTSGGTAPTGTIAVTGSAASLAFTATAASSSCGSWLTVTPTSGNTGTGGTSVQVGINPSVLNSLTAGTCNGTVTIAGTSGAGGSTTVNVSLTVTAPLPTITALVNAASFASGPVAPGEIVTIGGSAMGPATPAYLTTDQAGANVLTTLGGVQVLFSGIPAPLIYVSPTQINAVVPYGVAGVLSPFVQIKYLGQTSNAFPLSSSTTAPGIFTQNAQGTGPGAILNSNGSVNTPNNPAAKGSTVVIYMTGEGQTSPNGVTGKVTCPPNTACTVSQIPVPLLPVAITIGGQPASYNFAGEAPGFISGFLQVNVQIPANAPSGNLPVVVSIGPNSSQQNVTVSVQ